MKSHGYGSWLEKIAVNGKLIYLLMILILISIPITNSTFHMISL